jgi:hypothetical protein
MKAHIIIFFFCLILFFPNYASGQSSFHKHYITKEALESDASKIVADFTQYIRELGYDLPSMPKINIQTEESLIRLDRQNNTIIVPYWEDLSNEQKALFKSWRGENAEEFFIMMFNWFFIPHELGHFINPMIHDMNPYQCEQEANEVAVTFFRRNPENYEKLDSIKEILIQVLGILPKIGFGEMSEEVYFNTNYQKMGNDPNAYGYFQLKFILDILNEQKDFNIKQYINQKAK